jgi:hypothetical protein
MYVNSATVPVCQSEMFCFTDHLMVSEPNVVVELVALLLRILDVSGSDLDQTRGFVVASLETEEMGKLWNSIPK